MFEAAFKALAQMTSPPFRRVLLKSIGLALVMIVLIAIGLQRVLSFLATTGGTWAEQTLGPQAHTPAAVLVWENRWAAPVAGAMRRSGGQLVASGRLPVQAILAALDAAEATTSSEA